jgi:cyclase
MTRVSLYLATLALPFLASPTNAHGDAMQRALAEFDPPAGFLPPPLHPDGTELRTHRLADGVYALLSTRPPVDNGGFIVGERGVLVVDAQINATMAGHVQDAVRRVTSKPILYVVNTNYHGDHTFGNYAFPDETRIVAHVETAAAMRSFDEEKAFMLNTVSGDESVFKDVKLRLPDITFDDSLTIDLGGRIVELHHFGPGNTRGDTVVYSPDAKAAWTGNLVVIGVPPLFEGGAETYLQTIARFAGALDVQTIIPGHGMPQTGEVLGRYMSYLSDLISRVRHSIESGKSLDETLELVTLSERHLPLQDSPLAVARPLIYGFHRLGVQRTYREYKRR